MGGNTSNFNCSYADLQPLSGDNFYRIKQEDLNGDFSYTETKKVQMSADKNAVSIAVFPNPFSHAVSIGLSTPQDGTGTLEVRDVTGKIVATAVVSLKAGAQTLSLSLFAELHPGIYQLTAIVNGSRATVPLSKID